MGDELMYLLALILLAVWLCGSGVSVVLWTPSTPLGWITLLLLGFAFITHISLVASNRIRESLLLPGVMVANAIAGYFMLSNIPVLLPYVVDSSDGTAGMIRWLLGMS